MNASVLVLEKATDCVVTFERGTSRALAGTLAQRRSDVLP